MESTISPKYNIIDINGLNIVKQNNDTIISDNIKAVHDYFKNYPNIKCIYGDMIIDYDSHHLYKHMPTFEINFLSSPNWEPVLFYHTIKPDLSEQIWEVGDIEDTTQRPYDLIKTTTSILQQTFIHHIPTLLNIRKHE